MVKRIVYIVVLALAFSIATPFIGKADAATKIVTGYVTTIDPNGMFITVKRDIGKETTYYINKSTTYTKDNSAVDISSMYVGDRVKLTLKGYTSSTVSKIDIITTGVEVENLYKGTIQKVNSITNKLTVKNEQPFTNWSFGTNFFENLSTTSFQNNVNIYYGNRKITKNQLRKYVGSEVYYATVKQFNKEIIKKIVVLANNERTYYEPMTAVDTKYNFMNLEESGRMYFHPGTIFIRNGRLVEPTALQAIGTAFVVTDGVTRSNYAQVIQITNDSMTSPNLASHELYFGELSFADGYLVELDDVVKFENNYWKSVSGNVFAISNSTVAVANDNSGTVNLTPYDDLISYEGEYGYFYVKDGHINAIHLLDPSQPMGTEVFTGKLSTIDAIFPAAINVDNVSLWHNGNWIQTGDLVNMSIDQATIIKSGEVIKASQLKKSDRVVILSDSTVDSYIILVD